MKPPRRHKHEERGSTLLLAAFALLILLAMGALAIDVATLYVARTEAQRAADAAALAGANAFATSGCTNAGTCDTFQSQARTQAKAVGDSNDVFGQAANIADADVTFSFDHTNNPFTQVTIRRSVPTFLAGALQRFFGGGGSSSNVVAKATAEAFNPSGTTVPFATSCVKPWIVPNWDPVHAGVFINDDGTVANPGVYPAGVVVEPWTIRRPGRSGPPAGPPPTTPPYRRVGIADGTPANYQTDIEGCSPVPLRCGSVVYPINTSSGLTSSSARALINFPGQDQIENTTPPAMPYRILAGNNNPFISAGVSPGSAISTSSSVITVPVYNTCASRDPQCTVVGFMELFLADAAAGDLSTTILNVAGCPAGGSDPGTAVGGGASLLPVRLIQNP